MTPDPVYATISIVIPCYNEAATLAHILGVVRAADTCGLAKEIIVVDDGSRDQSVAIARAAAAEHPEIKVIEHVHNQGKGAALRTGFEAASGDIVLIQDADLEYSPDDYPRLLKPFFAHRADVVYGSRFRSGSEARVLYYWHSVVNKLLTLLSNMLTNINLTDIETCYKVFRREILQGIRIEENRFGFEPEITAKVAHLPQLPRIYEVGISYSGRTYAEGKKIGWRDGARALWCIAKYNLWRR